MKKILFLSVLLVAGCHDAVSGSPQYNMDKSRLVCKDGVEYLQFNNAYGDTFTPHLQKDGKPYLCN